MRAQWPTPNYGKPWPAVHDQLLREAFGKAPLERIARVVGRTAPAVKVRAHALGLANPCYYWSDDQVARLAEMRATGVTMAEAAKELGHSAYGCQRKALEMRDAGDPRFPKLRKWRGK